MQAKLHNFIAANWYGGSRWTLLLLPIAWVFELIAAARRTAYQKDWLERPELPVPVVIVGNITTGGTGKSPVVAWLAQQLLAQGRRPGIVSRGYGGAAPRQPVLVDQYVDPALVGDEPVMLARQTGCQVCVCVDRVAAVHAIAREGVDVVIADDGLQHYRLRRDAELAVVDAERGLGNRRLLPAGPLRERPARLDSVDSVLLNGAGSEIAGLNFFLKAGSLKSVGGAGVAELADFAGRRVWAVAGIGNPGRFSRLLETAGIQVDLVPVPDHGRVSLASLRRQHPQPILMTEKDAVKYADNTIKDCWYLPVEACFTDADAQQLLDILNAKIIGSPVEN
jgi:tetraacyldisaccharide 4'-kinase